MVTNEILFPPGAGGLPTLKMGFVYEAIYPDGLDRTHVQIGYADNNFPGRSGWKEVIALSSAGSLLSSSVPARDRSEELNNYPADLLNGPPQVLGASLVAILPPISNNAVGTERERLTSSQPMPSPRSSRSTALAKHVRTSRTDAFERSKVDVPASGSADSVEISKEIATPSDAGHTVILKGNRQQTPRSKFTELISTSELSPWFLFTAALIAFGLGSLHALEPGHGKTIVAAYLIGSRGTPVHAILLGLIVTASHTFGVFALGALTLYASHYIVPEQLYPWLGLLSGGTIAALGFSMALRRLGGTTNDHSHRSGELHTHGLFFSKVLAAKRPIDAVLSSPPQKGASLAQLWALGVTGGIIPCPAALIVLLSAFALHRIGLGFFLIVAFSIGLASVLIGFGMLMVLAGKFMSRFAVEGPLTERWLPLASSAFISILGTIMVSQAILSMNLHLVSISQKKIGPLLFVTGLGLVLGMRHSTDADHVVAISTIVTRQKSIRGAALIGSIWGIGHTITIFVVGSLIILFKVEIPTRVGLSMEFCVALMLVFLGLLNLSGTLEKVSHYFRPARVQAISEPFERSITSRKWQWAAGTALDQIGVYNCVRPLVIGLIHGLAGSAAVALLVLSTIHDPLWATLYLLIFGAGTMAGMMCMTAAMATPLTFATNHSLVFSRYLSTFSGMVSLAFGSFLVYQVGIVGGLFTGHPLWTPR